MIRFIIENKYGVHEVLIDDEDYHRYIEHGWCVSTNKKLTYKRVECTINYKRVRLHRFLLNIIDPKIHIDHIDNNPLNNQKSNLRLCNQSQNMRNIKKQYNKTGYTGVYKDHNRYRACISVKNKTKHIPGSFSSPEEAAKARDLYALEIGGEFAKLNFSKKKGEACGGD